MQGLIRGQALLRSPVARLLGGGMAPAVGRFTGGGTGRSGHTRVVAEYRKGGQESEQVILERLPQIGRCEAAHLHCRWGPQACRHTINP
jgi:hypothetical protein